MRRAVGKIGLALLLVVLVPVLMCAAALGWRLSQGPILLPWLDRRIEEALSGMAPGLAAQVGHTELAWLHHLPEVRVVGVKLERRDGKLLVSVPELGVRASLRAAIHGQLAVERLNVAGVRIALVRDASGRLLLGSGGEGSEQAPVDLTPFFPGQGEGGTGTRYLKRIRIRKTDVRLEDRGSRSVWRLDDATVEMTRSWGVFHIDGAARLRMDNPSSSVVRTLSLPFSGQADLDLAEDASLRAVAFDVHGQQGSVVPPGPAGEALPVASLSAKGALSMESRKLEVGSLHAGIGTTEIDSHLKISLDDAFSGLDFAGEVRSLPIADLERLWPPNAAASTREWITTNIHDGTVPRCRFAIRLPEGDASTRKIAANAVAVQFDFEGLTVDYLRELTPVNSVRGSGTLDAEKFEAQVAGGALARLQVDSGRVQIRFRGGPPHLAIAADVSGPAEDVLSVLEHPPLEIPQAIGIGASQVSGKSQSHVEIELPIKHGVRSSDVVVRAQGDLHATTVTNVLAGVGVEESELAVKVDGRSVDVSGEGNLTGLPSQGGRARIAVGFTPVPGGTTNGLKVSVEGKDVHATAEASLEGRALQELDVSDLRFSGNQLRGRVMRQGAGFHASIDASTVNLEPMLHDGHAGRETLQTITAPYDVDFRVQHLRIAESMEITSVQGVAHADRGRFATVHATGSIAPAANLRIDLTEQGPTKHLEIASGEAGKILKALGIFKDAEGGALLLTAAVDDRDKTKIEGELAVTNLRLIRAPILAKVLSVGSLQGIANLLQGEGLVFSRTRVPFTWRDGKVDVVDARAVGAIGITADGEIARTNHRIDFHGFVFPAYTLNSALGRIPWIGDILVGGQGQGLFGIEYWVNGDLNNPAVTVNALSALAPGALRKMFVDPFEHGPKPSETPKR